MNRVLKVRVDKNVPLPSAVRGGQHKKGGAKAIYPWHQLEVGDSFLFPLEVGRNSYGSATQASRYTGKRFTVRKQEERYRCWRVA